MASSSRRRSRRSRSISITARFGDKSASRSYEDLFSSIIQENLWVDPAAREIISFHIFRGFHMIAVRLATMDDAEAITRQSLDVQRMHHEAMPDIFKDPSAALFPPQKLASLLRNPNAVVAVAELDGKVIGHIFGSVANRA